jgi:hypothetical protein
VRLGRSSGGELFIHTSSARVDRFDVGVHFGHTFGRLTVLTTGCDAHGR